MQTTTSTMRTVPGQQRDLTLMISINDINNVIYFNDAFNGIASFLLWERG